MSSSASPDGRFDMTGSTNTHHGSDVGRLRAALTVLLAISTVVTALVLVLYLVTWVILPFAGVATAVAYRGGSSHPAGSLLLGSGSSPTVVPLLGFFVEYFSTAWGYATAVLLLALTVALFLARRLLPSPAHAPSARGLEMAANRLTAAFVVPAVALIAIGAVACVGAVTQVSRAATGIDLASVLPTARSAITAIGTESDRVVSGEAVGDTTSTNNALDGFWSAVKASDLQALGSDMPSLARMAEDISRTDLDNARQLAGVDTSREQSDQGYRRTVSAVEGFVQTWTDRLPNRTAAADASAMIALDTLARSIAHESAAISVLPVGPLDTNDPAAQTAEAALLTTDQARTAASYALQVLPDANVSLADPSPAWTNARALVSSGLTDQVKEQLPGLAQGEISVVSAAEDQMLDRTTAASGQSDALARCAVVGTIAVTLLLLALCYVGFKASPSRRRQLSSALAPEAAAAAEPASPEQAAPAAEEPRPVASSEDQSTAVVATADDGETRLLTDAFANVARRDQALVARQLSLLEELEQSEEDPDALMRLFALDNLATRMRRNADSLMVLAGATASRRMREPMPLSDVVRTASSQIEQYDRIRLDLEVDPEMPPHHIITVAHLLAELLENATLFSEPNTPIEVTSRLDGEAVLVSIIDVGLGMSEERLADANAKIAATASSTISRSQQLGLHVVGRLAKSLNIAVTLDNRTEGNGTIATVWIPRSLFIESSFASVDIENTLPPQSIAGVLRPVPASQPGVAPMELPQRRTHSTPTRPPTAVEPWSAPIIADGAGAALPSRQKKSDSAQGFVPGTSTPLLPGAAPDGQPAAGPTPTSGTDSPAAEKAAKPATQAAETAVTKPATQAPPKEPSAGMAEPAPAATPKATGSAGSPATPQPILKAPTGGPKAASTPPAPGTMLTAALPDAATTQPARTEPAVADTLAARPKATTDAPPAAAPSPAPATAPTPEPESERTTTSTAPTGLPAQLEDAIRHGTGHSALNAPPEAAPAKATSAATAPADNATDKQAAETGAPEPAAAVGADDGAAPPPPAPASPVKEQAPSPMPQRTAQPSTASEPPASTEPMRTVPFMRESAAVPGPGVPPGPDVRATMFTRFRPAASNAPTGSDAASDGAAGAPQMISHVPTPDEAQALNEEAAWHLAVRAELDAHDLQQRHRAYRPAETSTSRSELTHRESVTQSVPLAGIETPLTPRDPDQVRRRMAAFHEAFARGRRDGAGTEPTGEQAQAPSSGTSATEDAPSLAPVNKEES